MSILVTNASYVVIANNHVADNDQSLNYATATCPGQPAFKRQKAKIAARGFIW
jgi:hypothetical protein